MNGVIAMFPPRDEASRRQFIAALGTAGIGAAWLVGCSWTRRSGRQETAPQQSETSPPPPERPVIPAQEPTIRVRVLAARPTESSPEPRAVVDCDNGWILVRAIETGRMGLIVRAPLTVRRDADRWRIEDAIGFEPPFEDLSALEFTPGAGESDVLKLGSLDIPGPLRAVAVEHHSAVEDTGDEEAPSSDESLMVGAFDLVNHVPMELYLPGVLAGELYSHWHVECFHAQAVAARSYAAAEAWYWSQRRHFDVTATTTSQVYTGATTLAVARRAVERSRGTMLIWEDSVVPAYYSSCCGGVAAAAIDEISDAAINDIPPLHPHSSPDACAESPVYSWQAERQRHETWRRLRAFARQRGPAMLRELRTVERIEVSRTNPFGRPTAFTIVDSSGLEVEIPSRRLRAAIDFATAGLPAPRGRLRSSFVQVKQQGARLVFDGRGYGHGVGLCQYGAQALALRGEPAERILEQYYPEAQIQAAYA